MVNDRVLDNEKVYAFTCKLNRPLKGCNEVRIGLIEDSSIHNELNHTHSFASYAGYGGKIVMKGQLLNESPIRDTMTELHFRLCIAKQAFYYADSTHSSIN